MYFGKVALSECDSYSGRLAVHGSEKSGKIKVSGKIE